MYIKFILQYIEWAFLISSISNILHVTVLNSYLFKKCYFNHNEWLNNTFLFVVQGLQKKEITI